MKQRYAFISYNHQDMKAARWLHRKLEAYRLPADIHNEFSESKYLRPVFRDQEDLNTGILSEELRKNLRDSKFLIVICSPHSARSVWVNEEVKTFIEWGQLEYIIPFIIDGIPNSDDERECFPMALKEYTRRHPEQELLGIDVAEAGREKAFIRVISRMLDVSFDELWKRHERERRRRTATWTAGSIIGAALFYYLAVPLTVKVALHDERHRLPLPDDAVLVINQAEYPITNLDTVITMKIPGYQRGQGIPLSFRSTYYRAITDTLRPDFGILTEKDIRLERDETFARFAGSVNDEEGMPVAGAEVTIGGKRVRTDSTGRFTVTFPTQEQRINMELRIRKPGLRDIIRTDECPGNDLKFIMHPL